MRRPPKKRPPRRTEPSPAAETAALRAELARLQRLLALGAANPDPLGAFFGGLLDSDHRRAQWNTFAYRQKKADWVDALADEVVDLVWHDINRPADECLEILLKNFDFTVNKRAYVLSRIILYWTSYQARLGDFDILPYVEKFGRVAGSWGGFEFTWAEGIAHLAARGREEQARALLAEHQRVYNLKALDEYLPAAAFARRCGLANERIERSAELYEIIRRSVEDQRADKVFPGRTVALVGNGPGELGRGRGREIDDHEVVVRLNTYNTAPKYHRDYGARTDAWAVLLNYGSAKMPDYSNLKYLLLAQFPEEQRLKPEDVDFFLSCVRDGKEILCFSPAARRRCALELPKVPSSGLLTAALLKAVNPGRFTASDIYGMSFAEPARNAAPGWTHYDGFENSHATFSRIYKRVGWSGPDEYRAELADEYLRLQFHDLEREKDYFGRLFGRD